MPRMRTFLSGLVVGAADIVPGISGGTVAFIIGIYEELLASLASINAKSLSLLARLKIKQFFKSVHWQFLLLFVFGVACSFVTLAKGFQYLLNDETLRPFLYSSFMGLVVGSVIFCVRLLKSFTIQSLAFLVVGAVAAYFLSGADLVPKSSEPRFDVPLQFSSDVVLTNYDKEKHQLLGVPQSHLAVMLAKKYVTKDTLINGGEYTVEEVLKTSDPPIIDLWLLSCGAMAISAMLLPGISGSYLLNILGMYGFIIGALVDLLEGIKMGIFDFASFRICASCAIGIVLGAIVFARLVRYTLARYRLQTIATLVGFMVGAIGSVWPFWSYSYSLSPLNIAQGPCLQVVAPIMPEVLSSHFALGCCFFALGIAMVFLIEYLALNKRGGEHDCSPSRNRDPGEVSSVQSV